MQPIVYLVSNAVHMYAVYVLFTTVFGKSFFKRRIEALTYITYFLVNSFTYLFLDNMILNLASNIIPMFLIMLQYKKNIQSYLFFTVGLSSVGMFLDWIFTCINRDSILVKSNTMQSILFLCLAFLLRYFYKKEERPLINSNYVVFLILISIGTIVIGLLLGPTLNLNSFIISIILLAVNFLNFYLYDKLIDSMRIKINYNAIEHSNKSYRYQLDTLSEYENKMKCLKHDMENHFIKIQTYLENEKYSDAVMYINRMKEMLLNEGTIVRTGNIDIDCLMNHKLSIAQQLGTKITCSIVIPEKLEIDSFDLTVIIGNLMDNALKALKYSEGKILNINMKLSIGMIIILIENSFSYERYQENDGKEHGYGLISVASSLERYNGKLHNEIIGDKYVAKAVLYNKKIKYFIKRC